MGDWSTCQGCTVIKSNGLCNSAGQLLVTQVQTLSPTTTERVLSFVLTLKIIAVLDTYIHTKTAVSLKKRS
jgi:hypothetical protein